MIFTFLAVAAGLLTSSGSATTTVNPTTELNQHVQQVVTSVSTVAPRPPAPSVSRRASQPT